jgi:hypothetical protein
MNDEYRFRLLDAANQPASEMTMVCLDDEAALLLGERFGKDRPVEVWVGERLVGRIASAGPAPAAGEPAARRFKPFWAGAWRRGSEGS